MKIIRLDERLIHGQVAIKWSKFLRVNGILVLNDQAAENTIIKKSLLMAAPQDIKVAIKKVDDGIAMLNDPRSKDMKILVLVKTPQEVLKIIKAVDGIDKINVGNYGRVAQKEGGKDRKEIRRNLYLYESEELVFEEILDMGFDCYYQVTPDEKSESLKKLIHYDKN